MKPTIDIGKIVGTLVVTHETKPIDEHFETAAWYRRWQPDAGEYPVMKHKAGDGSWVLTSRVPCKCTDAYLGTLYGGVQVGRDTYSATMIGKIDTLPVLLGHAHDEVKLKPWGSHQVVMHEGWDHV